MYTWTSKDLDFERVVLKTGYIKKHYKDYKAQRCIIFRRASLVAAVQLVIAGWDLENSPAVTKSTNIIKK